MTEDGNFLFLILEGILYWNVRKRIKWFIRQEFHWWRHSVIEKTNRVIMQFKAMLRIYIFVFIIWVFICAKRRHGHWSVSFYCDFMNTLKILSLKWKESVVWINHVFRSLRSRFLIVFGDWQKEWIRSKEGEKNLFKSICRISNLICVLGFILFDICQNPEKNVSNKHTFGEVGKPWFG